MKKVFTEITKSSARLDNPEDTIEVELSYQDGSTYVTPIKSNDTLRIITSKGEKYLALKAQPNYLGKLAFPINNAHDYFNKNSTYLAEVVHETDAGVSIYPHDSYLEITFY